MLGKTEQKERMQRMSRFVEKKVQEKKELQQKASLVHAMVQDRLRKLSLSDAELLQVLLLGESDERLAAALDELDSIKSGGNHGKKSQ